MEPWFVFSQSIIPLKSISLPRKHSADLRKYKIPIGLNFGPTCVSTRLFFVGVEGANRCALRNRVCLSQVGRDFYQETLNKKVPSRLDSEAPTLSAASLVPTEERSAELVQAFARHIEEATRCAASQVMDKHPSLNFKVMAITVPEHWDVSARTVVAKAARLACQPLDSSSMILKLPQAVHLTYRMGKDRHDRCLVVLVYYHEKHLHLMLVQMLDPGYVVKGQVYLPHLGEDAILKESVADSPAHDDTTYYNTTHEVTRRGELKPILEALERFLVLTTLSHDANLLRDPSGNLEHAVRDVGCIVVDGEACTKGQRALHAAMKKMFASMTWLHVSEFHGCGARGANEAARMQLQNPKHLGDWRDLPGYLPEEDA